MKTTDTDTVYLTGLGKVIKAYEEIAATRMRVIRSGVVKNREFTGQLNQIFCLVKNSYIKETQKYQVQMLRQKNGRIARIFFSTNTGLYGDIIQRIFNLYVSDLKDASSDAIIIGRLGKGLFESYYKGKKYTYFEIADKEVSLDQIANIVEFLAPYESVYVYHGLFKNILMQEAVCTNISGDSLPAPEEKVPTRKLIFEPSLTKTLRFFETEIFSGLLVHVVFESQLAKFSSRMASLEQASENIQKERILAIMQSSLLKKRSMNKKQLEMMAGSRLWGV